MRFLLKANKMAFIGLFTVSIVLLSHCLVRAEHRIISTEALAQIGQTAKICALTFDDGPGTYTTKLLGILKERGIKATFFLVGDRVRAFPDIVRKIVDDGHEIGNHSEDHAQLRSLSNTRHNWEIETVQKRLAHLGVDCKFFRPPYGSFNARTIDEMEKLGLTIVLWTVDSEDWRRPPTVDGLISANGHDRPTTGIFLFHDIHAGTIKSLPKIIDYLQNAGVTFVTVSEYLGMTPPKHHPLPGGAQLHVPVDSKQIKY